MDVNTEAAQCAELLAAEYGEGREPASTAPLSSTLDSQHLHCAEPDVQRKTLATLRASLALAGGYSLHELTDGSFLVARWNLTRTLPDLAAVRAFCKLVGALR